MPPVAEGLVEEGSGAIPVRILIFQDGVLTGWDDGALGFEPGSIWFSGIASSFQITRNDFGLATRNSLWETPLNRDRPKVAIWLRHPTRRVCVKVSVHAEDGLDRAYEESRILNEISRLSEALDEPPASEYPPLMPRPGMIVRLPLRLPESWKSTILLLSFAFCLLLVAWWQGALSSGVSIAGIGILILSTSSWTGFKVLAGRSRYRKLIARIEAEELLD